MKANTHTKMPMDSTRKVALVAGLFYLATFVFSIPALGFYDEVLNNPDFVLGAGSESSVLWGGLFEVITALTGIGTAVVLYPVVRRRSQISAVGFAASRTLEAAMIFAGVVSVLSIVTLRQDFAGGDATGLVTTSDALLAMKDWTFLLGPGIMPAVNALCLATVLYRTGIVPRIIPAIGLVGAPILVASSVATLFGAHDQVSATALLGALPIAIWELSLGVWLTFKGFKPMPEEHHAPVIPEPMYGGAPV
jgi:hypothetical protein